MRMTWIVGPLAAVALATTSVAAQADGRRDAAGAIVVGAAVGAVIGAVILSGDRDKGRKKVVHHYHHEPPRHVHRHRHGHGHKYGHDKWRGRGHDGHRYSSNGVVIYYKDGPGYRRREDNVIVVRPLHDRHETRPRGRDYYVNDRDDRRRSWRD